MMTEQTKTPDLMLELLEKEGYQLTWLLVDSNVHVDRSKYGMLVIATPDGWLYEGENCYEDSLQNQAIKHELIKMAYAHYQERQELKALRLLRNLVAGKRDVNYGLGDMEQCARYASLLKAQYDE